VYHYSFAGSQCVLRQPTVVIAVETVGLHLDGKSLITRRLTESFHIPDSEQSWFEEGIQVATYDLRKFWFLIVYTFTQISQHPSSMDARISTSQTRIQGGKPDRLVSAYKKNPGHRL
jgi:hypothetical protein